MFKKLLTAAACAALFCGATAADDFKVGVVSLQRILTESSPAVTAQNKLKKYFKTREDEINRDVRNFKTKAEKFEKDSKVLTESERLRQRQELAETERDIARRQRALRDEQVQRSNEETQIIVSRVKPILDSIAKTQKYDLILQAENSVVYASDKIDITDQVIRQLNTPASSSKSSKK